MSKSKTTDQEKLFKKYLKDMVGIAKDLCYGDDVYEQIAHATSEREVERIMRTARLSML